MLNSAIPFICPQHKRPLTLREDETAYDCLAGCRYEVRNKIPRFVSSDNYAKSFGLQWNKYRMTQLDSFTGTTISRDRLIRIAGGSLDIFFQKRILEAGCGAGRFTEIMLDAGASVWAADLSAAVEANYQNCYLKSGYSLCQADIRALPFAPEQFDIVVCIGVIQHTPNPEGTIQSLCANVKPGGILLIDHYAYSYPTTFARRYLRKFLADKSESFAMRFVEIMSRVLWPFHVASYDLGKSMGVRLVRSMFLKWSPVVDYQDSYPVLPRNILYEWAVLDTHDTLTDHFKHLRSAEELRSALLAYGMTDIKTSYAGNGVEVRARKPV